MTGKLKSLRIHEVYVGRGNGENDAIGFGNVLCDKIPCLFFDVGWLVTNRNLCGLG